MKGKGKWLEEEITRIAGAYRTRGQLHLEKVDPPTRIFRGQVIFLQNPFLDFAGAWRERGGRAIFLEAKSTDDPKLEIGKGGLRDAQRQALRNWQLSGAAVGIIWGLSRAQELRWVPLEAIDAQLRNGTKHLKWDNATPLPRGTGWVTWDFLHALRLYHPERA